MSFVDEIRRRAAAAPRRLVFAEGSDPRILEAAPRGLDDWRRSRAFSPQAVS